MPTIDSSNDPYRWIVSIPPHHELRIDGLELAAEMQAQGVGDDTDTAKIAAIVRDVGDLEGPGDVPDRRIVAAGLKVMAALESLGNAPGRLPTSQPPTGSSRPSTG